jgi:hypothetical protein
MKLEELIKIVSDRTKLDIMKKTRKEEYTIARSIYYRLAMDFNIGIVSQVARSIDRNHATIIYSNRNIFPQLQKYFPKYYKIYTNLYNEISENKYYFKSYEEKYNLLMDEHIKLINETKILNNPGVDRMDMFKKISNVPDEKLEKLKIRFDAIVTML